MSKYVNVQVMLYMYIIIPPHPTPPHAHTHFFHSNESIIGVIYYILYFKIHFFFNCEVHQNLNNIYGIIMLNVSVLIFSDFIRRQGNDIRAPVFAEHASRSEVWRSWGGCYYR